MNLKLLFVLHAADRTGAPMMLLHFIRWLKANTDTDVALLFKEGGALLEHFEALGPVYIWRPGIISPDLSIRFRNALRKRIGQNKLYLSYPRTLARCRFDAVYLNTADCMSFAPMLKRLYNCRTFAHIHELHYSLQAYFPGAFALEYTSAISHFIAASSSVKESLATRQGIPVDMMTVFNEMISVSELSKPELPMAAVKKELGIGGHFTVGAAGRAGWRKGTDWFIQVAANVIKQLPANRIKFVWVGYQSAEEHAQAVYEIEKLGLEESVIFTGLKDSPQDYYQLFDLFLLSSREDPFPLAALEAAALGKPLFCFENTGGIPEIVNVSNGFKCRYGDIEAMSRAVIMAESDREQTRRQGENSAALARMFDVNCIAPKLYNFIRGKCATS